MHRTSVYYFVGLLLLAVAGFWPTYFAPPKPETDWHPHLHGVAMFAWVALLIAQSGLIAARRNGIHRGLGKVSFALVPLIVVSTLLLAGYRLRQGITTDLLYFLYVQLSLLAAFTVSFALAMANRHAPARHARYMVCAALTLVDPIVARIIYFQAGVDYPHLQVATYLLVDGILLALIAADLRLHPKALVYPGMLAFFVATQLPTFVLYKLPAWHAFAQWYAGLPLP